MKRKTLHLLYTTLAVGLCLCAAPYSISAASETIDYSHVASSGETAAASEVGKYGMVPIYGRDLVDGTYSIDVESSSSKFRIIQAELTVQDGEMEADITLSGTGYLCLYMGTGEEAADADEDEYIDFTEDADGYYTYTIPVEALDKAIACAAFSKRKEQWYDRSILFDASSLPKEALTIELPDYELIESAVKAYNSGSTAATDSSTDSASAAAADTDTTETDTSEKDAENAADDTDSTTESTSGPLVLKKTEKAVTPISIDLDDGEYSIEVSLTGGSGKATVSSPTILKVEDGKAYAQLQWSSTYYDYMKIDSETYLNTNDEGGYSTFEIPITAMDEEISVIGDTTAMGEPHEISYSLIFYSETIGSKSQMPQEAAKRVVIIALIIIVGGGILNHYVKKKRRV